VDLTHDLEKDMLNDATIGNKCLNDSYAGKLYAALCNIKWKHIESGEEWTCSWRSSGGIVAAIRNCYDKSKDENYLDWYCDGNEGIVDAEIATDIYAIGWDHLLIYE
jgi:hypothetical protein